ncbi:MAG TPA: hypothetical protein PLN21_09480 [Gemmatales bacterium]|nr:hypothetical protein [Gemmatales bacterium]
MSAKYAGVPICQSTPEVREWIEKHVSLKEFRQFDRPGVPSIFSGLTTFGQHEDNVPIRLNVLRWPTGASRWATYHFIATDEQLVDIRKECYGDPEADPAEAISSYPQDLILHGCGDEMKFEAMYLLPPRALSATSVGAPGRNRLWLCTLVDRRYWWNLDHCGDWSTQDASSWGAVFEILRNRIGLNVNSWDCPAVHADWLQPHIDLQNICSLPLGKVLDAVAWNVGRRVSFDIKRQTLAYAPVVRIREYDWHNTRLQANLTNTNFFRLAGGESELAARDLSAILPEKIRMTFSDYDDPRQYEELTVNTLADYTSQNGQGTVVFHNRLEWDESTHDERLLLLDRVAKAWLGFQSKATHDVVYNAHVDWLPEGLSDAIEWHESLDDHKQLVPDVNDGKLRQRCTTFGMAKTRAVRSAWNLVAEDLWHGSNASASGSRSSGQTYTITCADGSSQTVTVRRS